MPSKNLRSSLGICVEIMKAVKVEGNAKPSHILQRANLSYARLEGYIGELVGRNLISVNEANGNKLYCLTSAGESFLKEMMEKELHLSAFGVSL